MQKVTNLGWQNKNNEDLSVLSRHNILPEYKKKDSFINVDSKEEYVFE